MKLLFIAMLTVGLVGCFKMPGDTTAAPTAGKEYWVNKAADGCTLDTAAGEIVVAGPFATRDNAMRARDAHADCKKA
jgi:hypothetical protein